jgi:hypothetical protein
MVYVPALGTVSVVDQPTAVTPGRMTAAAPFIEYVRLGAVTYPLIDPVNVNGTPAVTLMVG